MIPWSFYHKNQGGIACTPKTRITDCRSSVKSWQRNNGYFVNGQFDYFVPIAESGNKLDQIESRRGRNSNASFVAERSKPTMLGLFAGKRLEVISDGACRDAEWIASFQGVETTHVLCWYHLRKKESSNPTHWSREQEQQPGTQRQRSER